MREPDSRASHALENVRLSWFDIDLYAGRLGYELFLRG